MYTLTEKLETCILTGYSPWPDHDHCPAFRLKATFDVDQAAWSLAGSLT
jgi:hypothetical protein